MLLNFSVTTGSASRDVVPGAVRVDAPRAGGGVERDPDPTESEVEARSVQSMLPT
jgi:hypothetical protein